MSCCLVGLQHNIVLGGCVVVLFLVVVWLYHSVVVLFLVAKAFAGSRQQAETIPWERRWL